VRRKLSLRYLCTGEEASAKVELIDVSRQVLDGNKRFSGICLRTAGEETARLIEAGQSGYTMSRT
jgi:hypothetical protein